MINMSKLDKKKKILITCGAGAVIIIGFLIVANFIVLDECASPCRHSKAEMCVTVCEKVTLMD